MANKLWRPSLIMRKEKPERSPKWVRRKVNCSRSSWWYKTPKHHNFLPMSNPSKPLPHKSKSQIRLELTCNNAPFSKNEQGILISKSPAQTRSAKHQGESQEIKPGNPPNLEHLHIYRPTCPSPTRHEYKGRPLCGWTVFQNSQDPPEPILLP